MAPAKKILIVDDEAMIRKAVHLALEKEGYEVVEAETGGEALRRIELSKPDLILLDIMLPDVSGFDVCRDIRKAGLRVPIIILSAKTEEIDVVVGLEIGAADYITKPLPTPAPPPLPPRPHRRPPAQGTPGGGGRQPGAAGVQGPCHRPQRAPRLPRLQRGDADPHRV